MSSNTYSLRYPDVFGLKPSTGLSKVFSSMLALGKEDKARAMGYYRDDRMKLVMIGNHSKRMLPETVSSMRSMSEGMSVDEGNMLGGYDLFFTPNQFHDWKKNSLLYLLHANYVDIDTIKHGNVTTAVSKSILADVLSQLESASIPAPNAIVSSGSGGWHLYWIYNQKEAYKANKLLWLEMTRKIISSITSNHLYTVDTGASNDPTRLLRLPGSFHGGAKAVCECVYASDMYDFDLLISAFELNYPKAKPKKTKTTRIARPNNLKGYWSKVYFALLDVANKGKLYAPSDINPDSKGNRDMFLFLSMNALLHIYYDFDLCLSKVLELNKRYRLYMLNNVTPNDDLVSTYMQACKDNRYGYNKDSIIRIFDQSFNTDVSDLFDPPFVPMDQKELKSRQRKSAQATHKTLINKTQVLIEKGIKSLSDKGIKVTMAKVAAEAGVSKRTVVNHSEFYKRILVQSGVS